MGDEREGLEVEGNPLGAEPELVRGVGDAFAFAKDAPSSAATVGTGGLG